MGITPGLTRSWLTIAIFLRITPEEEKHHVALLFLPDSDEAERVHGRIGLLWQLRSIRGRGSVTRGLLWGDVLSQPCGASLDRRHLLL
jgi:hypothetical protein